MHCKHAALVETGMAVKDDCGAANVQPVLAPDGRLQV